MAFVIFTLVRQVNLLRKQPPRDPTTKSCEFRQASITIKARRCPHRTSRLKAA